VTEELRRDWKIQGQLALRTEGWDQRCERQAKFEVRRGPIYELRSKPAKTVFGKQEECRVVRASRENAAWPHHYLGGFMNQCHGGW
jgi:hypothetical protein